MASQWYTHVVHTDSWTAGTDRGASIQGKWQRQLDMIKILNESSPELHLGLIDGEFVINKFAAWNSGELPALSVVISGSGTSSGGYSGFADPTQVVYTVGETDYSGWSMEGSYSVEQLAEGYWVEITGARISLKE